MHILIVDDNADLVELLRMLLEAQGYAVDTASDGAQAVQMVATVRPDVLLVDIGLPDVDGYEVARRVRTTTKSPWPFLVAMTGYGQPEDRRRAMEAGFDEHMVKPVTKDQLGKLLSHVRVVQAGAEAR